MTIEELIVAAAFFVFIPLVYKHAKAAIISALDKHSSDAAKHLEHAKALLTDAQRMHDNIKAKLDDAEITSVSVIRNAHLEAKSLIEDAQAEIDRLSSKKLELAEARIEQQERFIVEQLKDSIIKEAINSVNDMILNELAVDAQLTLIDNGIAKISKKLLN